MSYEPPVEQRSMVLDDYRNGYYRRALKNVINQNSVVLDLGSGLGILGFLAASLGARKVFLVEPATNLEAAKQIAIENQLVDKVEFVPKSIEQANLPDKVDIITSVFTGNFLLEEDLLPSLFYARDHYLKPNGVLIPDQAKMFVAPVSVFDYYRKQISAWTEGSQGISHRSMHPFALNSTYFDSFNTIDHTFLAKPGSLHQLDLNTEIKAECHRSLSFELPKAAQIDGFLGWFDARLGDEWLSTAPDAPQTHWGQVFLPVESMQLPANEEFIITVDRSEFGEWSWRFSGSGFSQQFSTFLSKPVSPAALGRRSERHKPLLRREGLAVQMVISRFDATVSVGDIAGELIIEFSDLFPDRESAVRFVQLYVDRFCE